jgi:DNA-binding XRE family transcriptional regulator
MVNQNLLKGKIAEAGMNQKDLAKAIGMTPKTLSIKMKNGKFGLDEADKIISVLHIQEPSPIFFAEKVT